ncbi:MAG: response regulator [bacterium]
MGNKILVVDDEPDIVEYLSDILQERGYTVRSADNGITAFEQVQAERPDLILLDVEMPQETGTGFYRKLTRRSELRDIPVIIVSGYHSRHVAVSKGVPVLDKPINEAVLLSEVARLLA